MDTHICCLFKYGPLTKYVKLRVAHAPDMPGTFHHPHRLQRELLHNNDPGMHHGTCVTHVPWCMAGSLIRSDGETFPAFRLIINQSLITGIFPDKLKIAKVVPFYKKGDIAKCDNYRPIPLLSARLFEKMVYNQLYEYFTKNKLFHENQYRFRTKHSTELAVTELTDRILINIDNKKLPLGIFMDLSKAFDTLDHKI